VVDRWGREGAGAHWQWWERGERELGQRGGRWPMKEKYFSFSTVLQLHRVKIESGKKYLETSEKYEIVNGGRFEYLAQLLYWAL
jgi:hypothetical protein